MGLLLIFSLFSCATGNIEAANTQVPKFIPSALNIHAELSSNKIVAGTITLLSLNLSEDQSKKPVHAEFEGIELPFYPVQGPEVGKYETVLGIPNTRKAGPGMVIVRLGEGADTSVLQVPLTILDGNYPSEILHVDQNKVTPTRKSDLARIRREQLEIDEIYKHITLQKFWNGPFNLPIQSRITSIYGTRRVFNGALKSFHSGVDLRAPLKTPVLAAAPGRIVLAKDLFYTGNTVMIDHGYGIITFYAHMSRTSVKVGQIVQAQELLGMSGKTGRANGPHLHWAAVVHHVKVNPLGLVEVLR